MKKNQAGIEIMTIEVPAGYAIGAQTVDPGTVIGQLAITFSTDNPWNAGQTIKVFADLVASGGANEWELIIDYSTSNSASGVHPKSADTRTHTLSVVPPSVDVPGKMTLEMDRDDDPDDNEATETWSLVIFEHPFESDGTTEITNINTITNPAVSAVYRWLAREHTTIDVTDFFDNVAGNQAVIIRASVEP